MDPRHGRSRMSAGNNYGTPTTGHRRTTLDVSERDRLAYWIDLICSLYVSLECDVPVDTDLFGEVEYGHVGEIDVTYLHSNSPRVRHTLAQVSRDGGAYFLVLMLRQ